MAKKRKTLPKDFREMLDTGNLQELIAVFDKCEMNATGGYGKGTALHFYSVPSELVRWLVENGADINAKEIYGNTPLHEQASYQNGDVALFLDLGANIEAKNYEDWTLLHKACNSPIKFDNVINFLARGADVLAKTKHNDTPLAHALKRASNIDISCLPELAENFVKAGTPVTEDMKKAITRLGGNFEFHRGNFNKEFLPETDAALTKLYKIFEVTPVKKRVMHDGVSPITVSTSDWEDQYSELWDFLIPSSGPAKTVQGEVIRITGKVRGEILRNGGGNWDSDFKKMLDALIVHLRSGVTLKAKLLEEATTYANEIRRSGDGDEELNRLCNLGLKWVPANPVKLQKPNYDR